MLTRQWLIAIPLAAMLVGSTARGSAVRDEGKIFSPRAVEEAQRRLERLEQKTHVPAVIETIDRRSPISKGRPRKEKLQAVNPAGGGTRREDPRFGDLYPVIEA